MNRLRPISDAPMFPVTSIIAVLSIVVTLWWWQGNDVSPFETNLMTWHGEPWRLLTAIFPHLGLLHLIFNLYWLWAFGTVIEEQFGRARLLSMVVLMAASSSAAQYALSGSGFGLSGVVYGLFGYLWVIRWTDRRYYFLIDTFTVRIFVGWFFLCIVLTVLDFLPIANTAHGVGALMGMALGVSIGRGPRGRLLSAALVIALSALTVLAGTIWQPEANIFGAKGRREADFADYYLAKGRHERAAELYRKSIAVNPDVARWQFNYGLALERLEEMDLAAMAFERAHAMQPGIRSYEEAFRTTVPAWKLRLAMQALEDDQPDVAERLLRQAVSIDGEDPPMWFYLGVALERQGNLSEARQAYEKAMGLDKEDPRYLKALQRLRDE
ncbi:MAG: rhomboid family intramembrane serine protease [Planctomycetota bacterium]|nr:rhomboid family intramembrane serine protease [Planctomycetota bacterium]